MIPLPKNVSFLKELTKGNLFRLAIVKVVDNEDKVELSNVLYSKIDHNTALNVSKNKQIEMNAYTPVTLVGYDQNTPMLIKLNEVEAQNLITGEVVLVGSEEQIKTNLLK